MAIPHSFTNNSDTSVCLCYWDYSHGLGEYKSVVCIAGSSTLVPICRAGEYIIESTEFRRLGKFALDGYYNGKEFYLAEDPSYQLRKEGPTWTFVMA